MWENWNSHLLLVGMWNGAVTLAVSQIVKLGHPMWPSNSTPICSYRRNERICPHKDLYANVDNSIIYNSPKVETINNINVHKPVNGLKKMLYVWYIYVMNGILFGNTEKWSTNTCYNMYKPWKYNKWKKLVMKEHTLYNSI